MNPIPLSSTATECGNVLVKFRDQLIQMPEADYRRLRNEADAYLNKLLAAYVEKRST